MPLFEPCQRCKVRQADRLIGTVAHCAQCANAFLEPIRLRQHAKEVWLSCERCTGTWLGHWNDVCAYCAARDERMREDERKELLWPPWAANRNGSRYDDLDDATKEVWRKTRGQREDADSLIAWANRLADAVLAGEITAVEADLAIRRITDANE